MTKRIYCPKCNSGKTCLAYAHFVQGSSFKHRFFRCQSCLHTWDRTQELKVQRAILGRAEFPRYFPAEP